MIISTEILFHILNRLLSGKALALKLTAYKIDSQYSSIVELCDSRLSGPIIEDRIKVLLESWWPKNIY